MISLLSINIYILIIDIHGSLMAIEMNLRYDSIKVLRDWLLEKQVFCKKKRQEIIIESL